MKKGEVNEEGKDDKSSNNELLQNTVNELLARLSKLEADKETKISPVTGGWSPEQMAQLIAAIKPKTGEELNYHNDVNYVLGPEDYDEVGVLFTAPSTGIVIIDDVRKGVAMRTPSRKEIFFMFEGQIQSRDERGKPVLNTFSCYLSRSKAEQKWLREHSLYGIQFSESGKKALSTDTMRMQKLQAYMLGISNLDNAALFARCKQAGLPVSNDVTSMRYALAEKQLDDHEASTENASKRMAREKHEEEIFLNDPTKFTRK